MWPYSTTVGLAGKAISIGTDEPAVIAALEKWRIPDVGEPTDYCLELHPQATGGKGRPLPGLYHGVRTLIRSRDPARVTAALGRVLASHIRPAIEGQIRIALMPVIRDGVALLVPPGVAGTVPDRWLSAQGFETLHTVSSLVDADQGRVIVDPPLGSGDEPVALDLAGWWFPPTGWNDPLSPGFAVAEAMMLVLDVTTANVATTLRSVAALVERVHPSHAPGGIPAVKDALIAGLGRSVDQ